MKKIKVNSKLSLNKNIVSHLNNEEMSNIQGGKGGNNFLSLGKKCTNNYGCSCKITRGIFCKKHMA